MENSCETPNGNGPTDNGHIVVRHPLNQPCIKLSLPWLDIKVFYVRISKCEIDDSTPVYLMLNHVPIDPDTLVEVNGVRTSINSDGEMSLLRRDRVDKKSEEATFVSTDSVRMTGSVKFQVFDKDVLVLSGVLELCNGNGHMGETNHQVQGWTMSCESDLIAGTGIFRGKQLIGAEYASPTIEVYIAGSFLGSPIILTKTLQLNPRKRHLRKGLLNSIPEYEPTEDPEDARSSLARRVSEYPHHKPENEDYDLYLGTACLEREDGELSWFNAGVRVGVGIGLSVCLGIGIGVGLLVRTYQGTTRNFRRRLL